MHTSHKCCMFCHAAATFNLLATPCEPGSAQGLCGAPGSGLCGWWLWLWQPAAYNFSAINSRHLRFYIFARSYSPSFQTCSQKTLATTIFQHAELVPCQNVHLAFPSVLEMRLGQQRQRKVFQVRACRMLGGRRPPGCKSRIGRHAFSVAVFP